MRARLLRLALLGAVATAIGAGALEPPAASASSSPASPRAIVVLLDCVSFTDVTSGVYPGFAALAQRGCTGLSTIPIGSGGRNAAAYATIGNGSPVPVRAAPPQLANGYEPSETVNGATAAEAYSLATGTDPLAGVLNPDIVGLGRAFTSGGGGRSAGGLGQSLRMLGMRTALIGNADGGTGSDPDRSAMLVAMDASGIVDTGAVGASVVVRDLTRPLGLRTDFDRIYSLTRDALADCALVVVETGDLQRARVEAVQSTPDAAAANYGQALADTDAFIERLIPFADERTLLVVVSTSVPADDVARGRSLGPVWIVGGAFPAGGALVSATTRHTGVLTLHDLAPTILTHVGVKPTTPMIGMALSGATRPAVSAALLTTLDRAGALHDQRNDAIGWLIFTQVVLLAALWFPWVQVRILSRRWWWMLPYAFGAMALALVLAPAFGSPPLAAALAAVAFIALVVAATSAAIRNRILALGILATTSVGALAIDLALGAPLARWSFLGYDLVVGGRFYGIGNEYEGVLVGASVVAAACLVALSGRHRRFAVGAVGAGCLVLVAMFAMPRLGADAGGALAAAIGVGVTFYGFAGGRFTWRRVAVLCAALVGLGVVGIVLSSLFGGSANSHVGRFVARLARGDISFASSLILGKVRANLYLLGSSPWRSVIVAAAIALLLLGRRFRARLGVAAAAFPDLARGVPGLVAGGLAVLAFNDSGVIALATLAPFAVLLTLTLIAVAPDTGAGESGL